MKIKKKTVLLLSVVTLVPSITMAQEQTYEKYRFGGYGEFLYQQMDYGENRMSGTSGSPSDSRSTVTIPRVVFEFDYKFSPSLSLETEIEFENGGTGSSMEFDAQSEGGEYEYEFEKGGEVCIEKVVLTKRFSDAFKLSAGHLIVPVGLTNSHHEPINFFGTSRPEAETMIIPSTWHETGIAVSGTMKAFDYQLQLVNGLDPNYFNDANWAAGANQGRYEVTKFTNPAIVLRLDYRGIPNTRFGASFYHSKTEKNSTKTAKMDGIDGRVTIVSADAQYRSKRLIARGNFLLGHLGDSYEISQKNTTFPKDMTFPRTVVASEVLSWGAEAGYNVGNLFSENLNLFPFVRYEYYDPMHDTEKTIVAEPRYQCEAWTVGVNYYPLPNLVLKADYKRRRIDHGNFNDENTVSLALGYTLWFFQK